MENLLLAGVLLVNVLVFSAIFYFIFKIRSIYRDSYKTITEFLSSPDDKTPSPLASVIDQVSQVVARAIIVQAKTTFMGMSSVQAKAEKKQAVEQVEAQYPMLGLLKNLSPGIQKSLVKNPALLNLAGQLLSKANPGQSQSHTTPSNGQSLHFDL